MKRRQKVFVLSSARGNGAVAINFTEQVRIQFILYFSREGVYRIIDSCCSLRTTLNPIPKRALEPN